MRIIAGKYGGRNIQAPSTLPVRPTTDYAKTGLFNILSNRFNFEEINVLDLFCGTGSISFEFASRGVPDITCVDAHSKALQFISGFADKIGEQGIRTIKSDVFKFLRSHELKYDIIFADPPFDLGETDQLADLILDKKLLKPGGWLIIEHQKNRILESASKALETRDYGNCAFSFFKGTSPETE